MGEEVGEGEGRGGEGSELNVYVVLMTAHVSM